MVAVAHPKPSCLIQAPFRKPRLVLVAPLSREVLPASDVLRASSSVKANARHARTLVDGSWEKIIVGFWDAEARV